MLPGLRPGDIVASLPLKIRQGDVVIARQAGREVIKRVAKIDESGYFLVGDNMTKSTDSRKHGSVKQQDILGRIVVKLPRAVAPVAPSNDLAIYLSYGLAATLLLVAIANLWHTSQLVTGLNDVLPGGWTFAAWTVVVLVLSQLLAVPYLLRLKLSPLAHVTSGLLSVLAPLIWCLIAIWSLGRPEVTNLLSGYVNLPASWLAVAILLLWLTASYVNLHLRNFELQARALAKRP